ncbi:MAG: flagellar biosynthesis protein FlhB [Deltaproteobacteria bacterium]|nr:flagellar biosynthesis protein FlhB [Deltaproteobacteria bacterium]
MPEGSDQEKTEQPSGKRRSEAREKGQVPQTPEVASVAVLFVSIGIFYYLGQGMIRRLMANMQGMLERCATIAPLNVSDTNSLGIEMLKDMAMVLLPLFFAGVIVAVLANIVQVGWMVSWDSVKPKFSNINPMSGISQIFSVQGLVELIKNILKLTIVGVVAYRAVKNEIPMLTQIMDIGIWDMLAYMCLVCFRILLWCAVMLLILALLDWAYKKWTHEQQLKMTKQEVKDESKQMEGDPMVKARIRRIQREMARKRMMEAVPKADVVITNPTHFAVALKYEENKMNAPTVTAKGADEVAKRIRELAKEHNVPTLENAPLARALYKQVDIGREVPADLFQAVAEILAYVYRLRHQKTGVNPTRPNGSRPTR